MGMDKDKCPYCGQMNLTGEDARQYCGCTKARKYRKILAALDDQSECAEPMKPVGAEIIDALRRIAHLICLNQVYDATVKLGDGTTIKIGGKVSRSARLKVEEKVDE